MSIKVLVADDSITIQKVIGIIFGSDEYSLTVVDNGKAAVDKAREINPDILLIDALMPGMSGYEVSEMVRSTPSLAGKPILILTGSFEPFDEEKARKCGADDFIAKPFESQQIITKVKELLELGRTRTVSAQVPTPPPPPPPPEPVLEQAPEVSAPIVEIPAPFSAQQPEAAQPPAPADDIWGAFTPEAAAPFAAPVPSVPAAPSSAPAEPDVFAIVTEENDAQLQQPAAPAVASPQHTGSQWIPVEENTFEFDEEVIAEPPGSAQTAPAPETSFGDISFDDDTAPQAPPAFSAVPEPQPAPPVPDFADLTVPPRAAEAAPATVSAPETAPPAAIAPAAALTEEQLRAAITGASREVIERIVWEVVPDLAEVMIREAIRKIKEGA